MNYWITYIAIQALEKPEKSRVNLRVMTLDLQEGAWIMQYGKEVESEQFSTETERKSESEHLTWRVFTRKHTYVESDDDKWAMIHWKNSAEQKKEFNDVGQPSTIAEVGTRCN